MCKQETADCIVVGFRSSAPSRRISPSVHGQYLTVKLTVNGEELRRSYSICSSPLDKDEHAHRGEESGTGAGSNRLVDKLKVGMRIEVMTPMGHFTRRSTKQGAPFRGLRGGQRHHPDPEHPEDRSAHRTQEPLHAVLWQLRTGPHHLPQRLEELVR
jgi:ferredoxin-NADP reductase